ncbi:hypothetical protein BB559_004035 [Furculomyces boomerangus]|uniref:Phospholipid/glycerol acyltransferase domain-containing protein n=2 Tax=Harpellales TaxID=61421 RepID=A0A2T9YH26_9FUNG|nr:hypothetical protein BB559_004035 [Furculomyces boomerangus]PWA00590.1 hypothetical protein BB558_003348 [Smittium angustum]
MAVSMRANRRFNIQIERWFCTVLGFILAISAPSELVISCDDSITEGGVGSEKVFNKTAKIFPSDDSFIIIANHQVYTDWVYSWIIAKLQNLDGNIKITLKASLKNIPVFGWGMRFFEFIFLERSWDLDKSVLDKGLKKIIRSEYPTALLLFPEGTTFTNRTKTKSVEFSEKMGLPHPNHLLIPRSTGMYHILQQLRGNVTYLYDFTIGYTGVRPDEFAEDKYTLTNIFYHGEYPHQTHVNIRRFKLDDIPTEESQFTIWLQEKFHEKDELLANFYKNGTFHQQPNNTLQHFTIKNEIGTSILQMMQIWILPILIYLLFSIF